MTRLESIIKQYKDERALLNCAGKQIIQLPEVNPNHIECYSKPSKRLRNRIKEYNDNNKPIERNKIIMKKEQEEPKKNKTAETIGTLITLAVAVYMVYLGITMMF